jgi:hypothetical protein
MLQNLPEKEQWSKEPQQSSIWLRRGTRAISSQLESSKTCTWMNFPERENIEYLAHFVMQSEKADYILRESGLINWNQLELPWIMYQRPSSWLAGLTPDSTETENLHSFNNVNFGETKPQTLPRNNKLQSQDQF